MYYNYHNKGYVRTNVQNIVLVFELYEDTKNYYIIQLLSDQVIPLICTLEREAHWSDLRPADDLCTFVSE